MTKRQLTVTVVTVKSSWGGLLFMVYMAGLAASVQCCYTLQMLYRKVSGLIFVYSASGSQSQQLWLPVSHFLTPSPVHTLTPDTHSVAQKIKGMFNFKKRLNHCLGLISGLHASLQQSVAHRVCVLDQYLVMDSSAPPCIKCLGFRQAADTYTHTNTQQIQVWHNGSL